MSAPHAVLERLERLRALAADESTTEHERALAAERAVALTAKYDLQPTASPPAGPPEPVLHPWPGQGLTVVVRPWGSSTGTVSTSFNSYWRVW